MRYLAIGLALIHSVAVADTAEFKITDDPELDRAVAEVRQEFMARRAQNQPNFTRLDVTVLVPGDGETWRRGSFGGEDLHYPASTVKLHYMAAAAYWERINDKPVGFLEPHVGPMIRVSDNVATGRVIDAITGTTNHVDGDTTAPAYEDWKRERMFPMDYLTSRGLLGNQLAHNKTYPTNSGGMPVGYEGRLLKEVGRNALQTKLSASLLLEIIKGKLEPRSTEYMRGLLTHDRWGSDSVLGFGVPPGAIYENKTGRAYDTLADFAYIKMPGNGREMILAVLSNAYCDTETEQPRPYGVSVLGSFAEALIERLGLDEGAPPKVKRDNSDAQFFTAAGDWATSTGAVERWGTDYMVSTTSGSATWKLAVPEAGLYEVCVWYPQGPQMPSDVTYHVTADGGETSATVDQRSRGGRWVKLGDFELSKNGGAVTVSSTGSGAVAADAVKATKWSEGAAPKDRRMD